MRGDQNSGPGYQIRDEINLRHYETGTVGITLSGKDAGGSPPLHHSPKAPTKSKPTMALRNGCSSAARG